MNMVSVVIPTANDSTRLFLTLSSLAFQNYKNIEVIVIGKPSVTDLDKTTIKFKDEMNVRCLTQRRPSRAEARNMGIKECNGSIILFVDDDLILVPDFVSNHVKHHVQHDHCVVLGEVKNLFISKPEHYFQTWLNNCINKELYLSFIEDLEKKSKPHPYFSLTRLPFLNSNFIPWIGFGTNNASVRKEHIAKINGFDENYKGWGYDNIELGLKLYNRGLPFYYEPEALNYHLSHPRNKSDHLKELTKNFELFRKRNPGKQTELYWEFITGKLSIEKFNDIVSGSVSGFSGTEHFYHEYQNLLKWLSLLQ